MNSRRHFLKTTGLLTVATALPHVVLAENKIIGNKTKIKPAALKQGDTIAITSPAGAVWDQAQVETFSNILKGLGFKIVLGKTLTEKFGYFAGTDELRAKELNDFLPIQTSKVFFV